MTDWNIFNQSEENSIYSMSWTNIIPQINVHELKNTSFIYLKCSANQNNLFQFNSKN